MSGVLRKSARGKPCYIRLFPWCEANDEATVACHVGDKTTGMAMKSHDIMTVYGCNICHDILDGRRETELTEAEIYKAKLWALELTLMDRLEHEEVVVL